MSRKELNWMKRPKSLSRADNHVRSMYLSMEEFTLSEKDLITGSKSPEQQGIELHTRIDKAIINSPHLQ